MLFSMRFVTARITNPGGSLARLIFFINLTTLFLHKVHIHMRVAPGILFLRHKEIGCCGGVIWTDDTLLLLFSFYRVSRGSVIILYDAAFFALLLAPLVA
jgi:hypothetical protein